MRAVARVSDMREDARDGQPGSQRAHRLLSEQTGDQGGAGGVAEAALGVDVVAQRAGEEGRVLLDEGDAVAESSAVDLGEVHVTDLDCAGRWRLGREESVGDG